MRYVLTLLILVLAFQVQAQVNRLRFMPQWGQERLELNQPYFAPLLQDSVVIHTFRFYVSQVRFYKNGKQVATEKNSYHLMDIEDKMVVPIATNQAFDAVSFQIGIDSMTNVSGALGGDLDPTKGMYWTWQSGYINFKIEGSSAVCNTRNHEFQWHIGGYQFPEATVQELHFSSNNQKEILVAIDLQHMFEQVNLKQKPEVMSPGKDAVHIASVFKGCFFLRE